MLTNLFKPKWQHKDAKVRMQALSGLPGDGVELIQIAQTDPDTGVRMEAILHLTHLPTLVHLGHASGLIGERARQRVIGLAATNHQHDHLLADVFHWLTNPALLRSIARDPERGVKLRRHALEALTDEDLLFDIASNENSKELQYLAASRLRDVEKLRLLEKQHGKNNKRLRQLLKERQEQLQKQRQLQAEVESTCVEAESLGKSSAWEQDRTRTRVLQQRWKQLVQHANDGQQQRFEAALEDFQQRLAAHEAEAQKLQPLRDAYQSILEAAETLRQQLEETPETQTLSGLDSALGLLARGWGEQEKLPAEEQHALDEAWGERHERLKHLRDSLAGDLAAMEKLAGLYAQAEALRQQPQAVSSKAVLGLQSEWANCRRPQALRSSAGELEQQFARAMDALNSRLQKQQVQRENTLKELHAELKNLEETLESEQYGEAIELHHAFLHKLKETQDLPQKEAAFFQRRIQMLTPFIRELQDWRRWGTDQVRQQLIETAEHLRDDDGLDPQERAKRVQELRDEWRGLARIEPGQQRAQWKEFDSTVSAAYEPSKQHFVEQAQKREANLQQRAAVCVELEALETATDWETVDWRALQQQVNKLRKQWKNAGTVAHKDWQAVNARFNAAMDALEVHCKAERQRNWQEREQLAAQAQALTDCEDTAEAIERAKTLQGHWRITLASRPADEQRLWKHFREPIDAVFARAKTEQQQQRSERNASITTAEAVCVEAEQLLQREGEDFLQATRDLHSLEARYNSVEGVPGKVSRALDERLHKALLAVDRKRARVSWELKLMELDELAEQSRLSKQTEQNAETLTANQAEGEKLCLQLEILLNLPTPSAFQQARMQHQIAQMSESMRTRKEPRSPTEQALPIFRQWYALGGMPPAAAAAQEERIAAVRMALENDL